MKLDKKQRDITPVKNYIYLSEELDSSLIQSVLETLLWSVFSILTVLMEKFQKSI